ncbi:THUMP domain-containing protein 1 homolog [Condylostylus longicornis]|uniref:THUMP domain-containing protein 1 homolog n=1 Tax=Condylostylus longicornis TaxID=2530218 RepID=UPI00244E3E75|nr:THUMP domain-containing protein 1 homolog [Condylostylus longicornis]
MEETISKRRKISKRYKNKVKNILQPGQKGFLVTCNFREKDCVRECYNILNEYANKIYGVEKNSTDITADGSDITDELEKEIINLNSKMKNGRRFQNVETKTTNCIFIKTTIDNPVDLAVQIIKDMAENQIQKSKHILRFVPILKICPADIKNIVESAGELLDEIFLKGNITYSIQFNKRYNDVIHRMDVIRNLAKRVSDKSPTNKVDLKNAEWCVIVEIIRGLCLLSIVPEYLRLKKYNIAELVKPSENIKQLEVNIKNKFNDEKVTECNENNVLDSTKSLENLNTDKEKDNSDVSEV